MIVYPELDPGHWAPIRVMATTLANLAQLSLQPQQETSQLVTIKPFKSDFHAQLLRMDSGSLEVSFINDILMLLAGVDGLGISRMTDNGIFFVDEVLIHRCGALKASMKLFELAYFHEIIGTVVNRVSLGEDAITHIFSSAVWEMGQDLVSLASHLEKGINDGTVKIHQATFLLEPFAKKFKWVFDVITSDSAIAHGPALLRRIESSTSTTQGDYEITKLATGILEKCMRPVIDDLSVWIFKGTIKSKLSLVQEVPGSEKDNLPITMKYQIVMAYSPACLEKHAAKILQTGLYGIILRQNKAAPIPSLQLPQNITEFLALMEQMWAKNGRELRDLFWNTLKFKSVLHCLRQVYLGERGDLVDSYFELYQKFADCERNSCKYDLQALYVHNLPILHEAEIGLEFSALSVPVFNELNAILGESRIESGRKDAIWLVPQVELKKPLDLIFTDEVLSKYKILFRIFAVLRRIMLRLSGILRKRGSLVFQKHICIIQQVTQSFYSFLLNDVVASEWWKMAEELSSSTDVESMLKIHDQFLTTCVQRSTFANAKIVACWDRIDQEVSDLALNPCDELAAKSSRSARLFFDLIKYYSSKNHEHHLLILVSKLDLGCFYADTMA